MDRQATREYAARDWSALDRLRLREKAAEFRRGGPAASILASRRLWEFAERARGSRSQRSRASDLEHHVELKRRLDRAARAFRVR